ncbi:MAG: nitrite/sulfite reductase [Nevskia sp.]|nr:nitrite/sulfite reductase [Nevskia sp.]
MYRYDEIDQALVNDRVAQFRDQTRRFLDGSLSEDEFRGLRLRNGFYIQRFGPMLRVSIPYGMLNAPQLRMLAHIARKYDKGYGHFTTRTNIQYNWPKLEQVPDILADLATVQMHAIQTSGNCIRNVTTDALAGVARDEIVDPRPYCELTRQWASFHPEFNWLPRKFKIAFSASAQDRAATVVHDIGVHIRRNADGELGYTIYAGGGLGRMPILATKVRDFLPEGELLPYCEAILRVYNRLGRRDNIHRARIKIVVKEHGADKFRQLVEEEYARIDDPALRLTAEDIERMRAHFTAPAYAADAAAPASFAQWRSTSSRFAAWARRNLKAHRVPGYHAVMVSLKPIGGVTGDCSHVQLDALAELAERYSFGEIRVTYDQNLLLADVRERDLYALWQQLDAQGLATPNIGLITDIIACPGLDFCSLANAGSIGVSQDIQQRFEDLDYQYDVGELRIKISGCMNGCGHHSVGHIGILGVDKHGEEWYQVTLGGGAGDDVAALGERTGPAIARADIAEAVERIVQVYLEQRGSEDETFLETFRRVGMAPFKARIYAESAAEREAA